MYLNTLLFIDEQLVIQDSEDKLQKSVEQRLPPQNIYGQNKNYGF